MLRLILSLVFIFLMLDRTNTVTTECEDESIAYRTGMRKSLNYPLGILHDMDCFIYWVPGEGLYTALFFADMDFPGEQFGDCGPSYLEILYGDGHVVTTLCDDWDEGEVGIYFGESLHIYIHTNSDSDLSNYRGFKVTWETERENDCLEPQVFTRSYGTLCSPNYPIQYYNYIHCTYIIDAGESFTLEFTSMDIETDMQGGCYDYVTVIDGDPRKSKDGVVGDYCGTELPAPFVSTGSVMALIWNPDTVVGMKGFEAKWYTKRPMKPSIENCDCACNCGGKYKINNP